MLSIFFKKRKKHKQQHKPTADHSTAAVQHKGPYLTQTVVFGMHIYRRSGEDSSVYLVDESRRLRKQIVDSEGRILNFPGIIREDRWVREVSPAALKPQIRFRTSFEKRGDRWLVLWQIQPDGRYWEDDDGFGAENDLEVTLYTYLDEDGNFTGPFRLYELGGQSCKEMI